MPPLGSRLQSKQSLSHILKKNLSSAVSPYLNRDSQLCDLGLTERKMDHQHTESVFHSSAMTEFKSICIALSSRQYSGNETITPPQIALNRKIFQKLRKGNTKKMTQKQDKVNCSRSGRIAVAAFILSANSLSDHQLVTQIYFLHH